MPWQPANQEDGAFAARYATDPELFPGILEERIRAEIADGTFDMTVPAGEGSGNSIRVRRQNENTVLILLYNDHWGTDEQGTGIRIPPTAAENLAIVLRHQLHYMASGLQTGDAQWFVGGFRYNGAIGGWMEILREAQFVPTSDGARDVDIRDPQWDETGRFYVDRWHYRADPFWSLTVTDNGRVNRVGCLKDDDMYRLAQALQVATRAVFVPPHSGHRVAVDITMLGRQAADMGDDGRVRYHPEEGYEVIDFPEKPKAWCLSCDRDITAEVTGIVETFDDE